MDNVDSIVAKSKKLLFSYSDDERKKLSLWYYPTSMEVYGLSSANLKKTVSEIKKDIKDNSPDGLVKTAIKLATTNIFECQLLAYGLLNRNYTTISALSNKQIVQMGMYMDNWVSTDSFSTQLAGPAWRLGALSDSDIIGWARSDSYWWRRNSLVATVGLNLKSQGGSGDAKRTIMICEMLVDDKNDMVVKAMSWALRELSKHKKEPVELFMASYSDRLAPRVKREVSKKLLTGRKNG